MARDKSAHHEKIIAAAREEFMTYGFTDASMRRIAAAAGMSVAGLYKHFTSKEEMFAALVEPACQGLISLYRQEEADERAALQTESLGDRWSQGGDAKLAMSFIYDNLDAFRLLICKSRGTRYESFLYDLSAAEEKITLDMMALLREQGMQINEVDPEEFHLLVTASIDAIFRAVVHDFSREQAMHYADTLDTFFARGWQELFGY